MWGRKRKAAVAGTDSQSPSQLKEAMHQARVEAAERSSVVVELRDAELARLELLNEALNPPFAEVPPEIDLFDRGLSRLDIARRERRRANRRIGDPLPRGFRALLGRKLIAMESA